MKDQGDGGGGKVDRRHDQMKKKQGGSRDELAYFNAFHWQRDTSKTTLKPPRHKHATANERDEIDPDFGLSEHPRLTGH